MWRTIYVFLSSTFKDMHYERDYIRKFVIPSLNYDLYPYKLRVRLVDLRWGINTKEEDEELREDKILKVCLDEIKRTRPYFIGILGNRYGWIPDQQKWNMIYNRMKKDEQQWFAGTQTESVTSLEIRYGALNVPTSLLHSYFFIRNIDSYANLPESEKEIYCDEFSLSQNNSMKYAVEQQNKLKSDIKDIFAKNRLGNHIFDYTFDISSKNIRLLKYFGDCLEKALFEDIVENHVSADIVDAVIDTEQEAFDNFVEQNLEYFIGREKICEQIKKKITTSPGIVLLVGGSGKSALFCKIYSDYQKESSILCNHIILSHSAGVSSKSNDSNEMLSRWIEFVASCIDKIPEGETEEERFINISKKAHSSGKKIFVFLDSIDRLDNTLSSRFMNWIQPFMHVFLTSLEENAKMVLSYHKNISLIELPIFSDIEAESLLKRVAGSNGKELYNGMLDRILGKKIKKHRHKQEDMIHLLFSSQEIKYDYAYHSPLWLVLAGNVLFNLDIDDFRQIENRAEENNEANIENFFNDLIDSFSDDTSELFLEIIDRTREDFGEDFVDDILGLIAVSKNGLSDRYIAEILSEHFDELTYAQFKRYMKGFLVEQGREKLNILTHTVLKDSLYDKLTEERHLYYHNLILKYITQKDSTLQNLYESSYMFHALGARSTLDIQSALWNKSKFSDEACKDLCEFLAKDIETNSDYISTVLNTTTELVNFEKPHYIKQILNDLVTKVPYKLRIYCGQADTLKFLTRLYTTFNRAFHAENVTYVSYILDDAGNKVNNDSKVYESRLIENLQRMLSQCESALNRGDLSEAEIIEGDLETILKFEYELNSQRSFIVAAYMRFWILKSLRLKDLNAKAGCLKEALAMGEPISSDDFNYKYIVHQKAAALVELAVLYEKTDPFYALKNAMDALALKCNLPDENLVLLYELPIRILIEMGKYVNAINLIEEGLEMARRNYLKSPDELAYLAYEGIFLTYKIKLFDKNTQNTISYETLFEEIIHITKVLGLYHTEHKNLLMKICYGFITEYIYWINQLEETSRIIKHSNTLLHLSILWIITIEDFRESAFLLETILDLMDKIKGQTNIFILQKNLNDLSDILETECRNRKIFEWNFYESNKENEEFAFRMNFHYITFKCAYIAYIKNWNENFNLIMRTHQNAVTFFMKEQINDNKLWANLGGYTTLLLYALRKNNQDKKDDYIDYLKESSYDILKNASITLNDDYLISKFQEFKSIYPEYK